ncbi:MAG: CBS domain-containing protein [Rhodoferax sp.]
MFSIYGKTGKEFGGTLEELRRVLPQRATQAVRGVRAIGQHGSDHQGVDQPVPAPPGAAGGSAGAAADTLHRSALAAYAQAEHPSLPRHPLSTVDAIMSRSVRTLPDSATVEQGWDFLAQHGIGQAPVVNAQGVLVGLFSRGELLSAQRLPKPHSHPLVWRAFMDSPLAEAMWTPVPGVEAHTDIRRVARVLLDTGLSGLPVVDTQGVVLGFVSRSDILHAVVADPPLDLWS